MTYTEMRRIGICVRCRKPSKDKALCPECSAAEREYAKNARAAFILSGICPVCKKNDLQDGKKRCASCIEKHRENMKRKRSEDGGAYRTMMRSYLKQRREQFKEKGLCVVCGKVEASEGFVSCEPCRKKKYEECKKYWKKE